MSIIDDQEVAVNQTFETDHIINNKYQLSEHLWSASTPPRVLWRASVIHPDDESLETDMTDDNQEEERATKTADGQFQPGTPLHLLIMTQPDHTPLPDSDSSYLKEAQPWLDWAQSLAAVGAHYGPHIIQKVDIERTDHSATVAFAAPTGTSLTAAITNGLDVTQAIAITKVVASLVSQCHEANVALATITADNIFIDADAHLTLCWENSLVPQSFEPNNSDVTALLYKMLGINEDTASSEIETFIHGIPYINGSPVPPSHLRDDIDDKIDEIIQQAADPHNNACKVFATKLPNDPIEPFHITTSSHSTQPTEDDSSQGDTPSHTDSSHQQHNEKSTEAHYATSAQKAHLQPHVDEDTSKTVIGDDSALNRAETTHQPSEIPPRPPVPSLADIERLTESPIAQPVHHGGDATKEAPPSFQPVHTEADSSSPGSSHTPFQPVYAVNSGMQSEKPQDPRQAQKQAAQQRKADKINAKRAAQQQREKARQKKEAKKQSKKSTQRSPYKTTTVKKSAWERFMEPAKRTNVDADDAVKPEKPMLVGVAIIVVIMFVVSVVVLSTPTAVDLRAQETEKKQEEKKVEQPAPAKKNEPPVIAAVTSIDPEGDNNEHPELADNMIDGQANTSWTSRYYTIPTYGIKSGIGIAITLEKKTTVSQVILNTECNKGKIELRATPSDKPKQGKVQASGVFSSQTVLKLKKPVNTDSLVLWFPELPVDPQGRNRATISEITVK